jgi:hypothetical protein
LAYIRVPVEDAPSAPPTHGCALACGRLPGAAWRSAAEIRETGETGAQGKGAIGPLPEGGRRYRRQPEGQEDNDRRIMIIWNAAFPDRQRIYSDSSVINP